MARPSFLARCEPEAVRGIFVRLVTFILIVLCATPAHAWNSLGHKVVAEIAWRQLEPNARKQIVEVIRRHPRFDLDFAAKMEVDVLKGDKAKQDHSIFQQAATWPDVIRGNKEFDKPTWHYVSIPLFLDPAEQRRLAGKFTAGMSPKFPTRTPLDKLNVLQAIAYCRTTLSSNAGPDAKAMAYCWLFHLVGGIHQPLHCNELVSSERFPKGDRGGNEIKLVKGDNLHSLWDNLLGRQYYMRNVDKAVAELSNRNRYGQTWESAAKEMDPRKWAEESHKLCEEFVYPESMLKAIKDAPPGEKLSPMVLPDNYSRSAGHQARLRIIAAGLRLGAVLKSLDQ